jgi:hypothetical protein
MAGLIGIAKVARLPPHIDFGPYPRQTIPWFSGHIVVEIYWTLDDADAIAKLIDVVGRATEALASNEIARASSGKRAEVLSSHSALAAEVCFVGLSHANERSWSHVARLLPGVG